MSVLFSIVVTTYNRSNELSRALSKLKEQAFNNYEIIVCDDCSTDDTKEIIHKFKNIKYMRNEINVGCSKNTKIGLDSASGEFVIFLADDDLLIDTDFLKKASNFTKSHDIIFGRSSTLIELDEIIEKYPFKQDYTGKEFLAELAEMKFDFQRHISFSSFIFRRSLLKKVMSFNPFFEKAYSVDIESIIRCCMENIKIKFIDSVVYQWKKASSSSLSGSEINNMTFHSKNLLSAILGIYHDHQLDMEKIKLYNEYVKYVFRKVQKDKQFKRLKSIIKKIDTRKFHKPVAIQGDKEASILLKAHFDKSGVKVDDYNELSHHKKYKSLIISELDYEKTLKTYIHAKSKGIDNIVDILSIVEELDP